jgi:hypothetical protein
VPPYNARSLVDTEFGSNRPLLAPAPLSREKGWRAAPIWDGAAGNVLGVRRLADERQVVLGFGLGDRVAVPGAIAQGSRAVLAQEIRSARGGHYTFTVQASGGGTDADYFRDVFLAHFTCRLVLFRFADAAKDPRQVQELGSAAFQPAFGDAGAVRTFGVDRFLGSTQANVNFAIGNGLGVAVVVEKTSPGVLRPAVAQRAFVRLHSVALDFNPRPRDDSVID